jgi:RHS repeat-associated protein
MNRYVDCPVSYSLGQAEVSIPIVEMASRQLTVPVSLSYDGSGIHVDDISGTVGLGWLFQAGGSITREVACRPDEHTPDFIVPEVTAGGNFSPLLYLASGADTDYDRYSYSFCGYSGSFYRLPITPGGNKHIVPAEVTDLVIEEVLGGFRITDPSGVRYFFTLSETSSRYMGSDDPNAPILNATGPGSYSIDTITSWHLTRIESADGRDWITISYEHLPSFTNISHSDYRSISFPYWHMQDGGYVYSFDGALEFNPPVDSREWSYTTTSSWSPFVPSKIEYAGGSMELAYEHSTPPSGSLLLSRRSYPRELSSIILKDASGYVVQRWELEYDSSGDGRALLLSVSRKDRNGTVDERWSMEYISPQTFMGERSVDLFGYYNGAANGRKTFLRPFDNDNLVPFSSTNRSYNATLVQCLSLRSITTLSGSRTKYYYEPNSISADGQSDIFTTIEIGQRIRKIVTTDLSSGTETLVREREFQYENPGCTVPVYAFRSGAYIHVTEWNTPADGTMLHNWWGPQSPLRICKVTYSDKSNLPGVPLESARIFYRKVTERISVPGSGPVKTVWEYDGSSAVCTGGGSIWHPSDAHDDAHTLYSSLPGNHFHQRVPSTMHTFWETSHSLLPLGYHLTDTNKPSLGQPVRVTRYRRTPNGTEVIASREEYQYEEAMRRIQTGMHVEIKLSFSTSSMYDQQNVWCPEDFDQRQVDRKIVHRRLKNTTLTEYLDDGSPITTRTSYLYDKSNRSSFTGTANDSGGTMSITYPTMPTAPSYQVPFPEMGSILSPRLTIQVFGDDPGRIYSRYSIFPDELAALDAASGTSVYAWAQSLLDMGYRKSVGEEVIVGGGIVSGNTIQLDPQAATGTANSISGRYVTWAPVTPADTTGITLVKPSKIEVWRKEKGDLSGYLDVGPTVRYSRYDRWGNPLEIEQDGQPAKIYLWGYKGLRPVAEIAASVANAGTGYTQVRSAIGASTVDAIATALNGPSSTQFTQIRSGAGTAFPDAQVSLFAYRLPFGLSLAEDPSGRKTTYEYDAAGRLSGVKDEDGKLVEGYLYELTRGGQSQGQPNRILSLRYTAGSATTLPTSIASALTASAASLPAMKDVVYLDGLGRSVQQVSVGASTGSRDIVTPVVPDFLDHEDARTYLPYPAATSSSTYGSFRTDALTAQQTYYNGLYGTGSKTYGENVYELSSRGRVTETSLPGITERSTLATKASPGGYLPILSFDSATQNLSASGYHAAGRFTVTTTEGADGSLTESWTDEFGTPVLERVRIKEEDASTGAPAQWAETCYVKDRRGRVLCVIPPEEFVRLRTQAGLNAATVSSFSAEHCYTYAYDGRDRVVNRHLPDQALETLSYNDADLVTSKERTAADGTGTETFVTDYDVFNRPVKEKYRYGSGNTITLIRYAYDTDRDTLAVGGFTRSVPSFVSMSGIATTSDKDARLKGLKTAELVRILPAGESETAMTSDNNAQYIARSYHYDKKGNVIQVAESRPDVGVTARTSSQYGFAGNVLKTRQTADLPAAGGGGTVTVLLDESFSYDTRLRPTSHSAKLTSGGTAGSLAVFNHQHDALGRPYVAMRLIANAMDVTTDTYTIQGWLKSSSGPSFEETLFYDTPSRTATDALPGKAGLITEWTSWQKGTTANGAASQSDTYAYEYDGTRRLVGSSRYSGTSTSPLATLTEKDIAYDRNGSLLSLKRYGASSGTAAADSLSFTYTGTKRSGYSYDAHGNVTADPIGGTALAWNVIGLPMSVSDGTDTTRRVYAADGTLLAVYSGTTGTEGRVRIGSFDILSSSTGALSLESAGWEGGRLLPGTGYDKILYHITDHLGSLRVVKDGTGAVRQRFDYYPFGSISGSWSSSTNPSQPSLRYRFSGKEIAGQNVDASPVASALAGTPAAAAGTPYLDFGARLYDPRSASWLSQDPLAEKYYGISPYAYCAGDPVNLVDLKGNHPVVFGLISASIDLGTQIGVKMLKGDDFNGAIKKVDWTSVITSGFTGAVSPKKTLDKIVIGVVLVADAAIDSSIDVKFQVVGHPNEEKAKPVANAAIDAVVGVVGVQVGETVKNVVTTGLKNEASSQATATLTKQTKQQAKQLAEFAAKKGVQFAEGQVVSSAAKGTGEILLNMPVEAPKEPLRLQLQGQYYNPSSFGYIF